MICGEYRGRRVREGHYFVTSWIALRVRACGPRFAEGSLLLTSRERVGVCVKESPGAVLGFVRVQQDAQG